MDNNDNIFNNDLNNSQNNITPTDNNQFNNIQQNEPINNTPMQNDFNQVQNNYSAPINEQPPETEYQNNPSTDINQFNNNQPSMNIVPETNINSGNNNNKKSKKGLKIVLIILVLGLLAGAGFLFGPKLFSSNGSNGTGSDENVKITGSVEFIKEYDYDNGDKEVKLVDEFAEGPYFLYLNEKENKEYVLDKNGKSLIEIETEDSYFDNIYYIKDGYFTYYNNMGEKITIYNINGYKKEFKLSVIASAFYYKNGILYISSGDDYTVEAYDLKNDKQLWKTKINYTSNPYVLDNGIVTAKKTSGDEDDYILLNSTDGKIIQTPECEDLYVSKSAYYAVNKDKVDVYDYENNKLYTINLGIIEGNKYTFGNVLNTGGVIIGTYPESDYEPKEYIVYNKSGKEIFRYGDEYELTAGVSSMYKYADSWYLNNIDNGLMLDSGNSKYSLIAAEDSDSYRPKGYVVFDDDTHYELYEGYIAGNVALGYVEDDLFSDVKSQKIKVINLQNKTEKVLEEDLKPDIKTLSAGTNYYIIKAYYKVYYGSDSEYSYLVYDKDYNVIDKISQNESVYPVNEDYYIKVSSGKIILINSNTKEENVLDVKGSYSFNTENNLVTRDDNKQYLYKFK